jgi:uncharacterized protein (DUF1501 family)
MDTITRRRFLIASGCAGVAAATVAATGYISWSELAQKAMASPLAGGTPILVVITLYGGNDGLNMVVPYADPAYQQARPDFAYSADEVHRLDGTLGLNPSMNSVAALWQTHNLAIVRGVGYPNPDHSHFRSMDIWQTASPAAPVATGWIGRWLDATGDDPTRAVSIGSTLPPLAVGARCAAASLPLGADTPLPAPLAAALAGLGKPDPTDTPARSMVATSYSDERRVAATLVSAIDAPAGSPAPPAVASATGTGAPASGSETTQTTTTDTRSAAGTAGAQSDLGRQLDMVARCVKAGVPTTAYSVSLGGFDTHAGEKATQETQLATLDAALSGFFGSLRGDPRASDVVVLVYSEFGRRVHANAAEGTDHGTAGPVLVIGDRVKGGFYGEQPSLTDLDDGDLKATVDFRTVYAELTQKVLRADPGPVVPAPAALLGFLA